jgi:hypothetical protein
VIQARHALSFQAEFPFTVYTKGVLDLFTVQLAIGYLSTSEENGANSVRMIHEVLKMKFNEDSLRTAASFDLASLS